MQGTNGFFTPWISGRLLVKGAAEVVPFKVCVCDEDGSG